MSDNEKPDIRDGDARPPDSDQERGIAGLDGVAGEPIGVPESTSESESEGE